eukprot:311370_1
MAGVKYDMIALQRLFEQLYGFRVFQENGRMLWATTEITKFFERAIEQILINENGLYDGIIIIISTHGGSNEVIYDSYEEAYNLHDIYKLFGEDNPGLLDIPRVNVIDACRGNITDFFIENVKGGQSDDEESILIGKKHRGSNRVTLFGNSPGIVTSYSYSDESNLETTGASFFIRSIIEAFREYEKNKNDLYTPNLME